MSNRGPDYPERVIASLPKRLQVFMAKRVLEGYKFHCAQLSDASNRWWSTTTPEGKRLGSVGGGLNLEQVLNRLEMWINASGAREKRDGILAKERQAQAAQLGHGARPKARLTGLHRAP